uniref:Secreted protein n=1 Tax=Globodera pallida TaxID=36090 RepID=A0A183CA98_GLOPA
MNAQLRLATLLPTVRMARTSQQSANQTPTSHTPGSLGLVGHGLRLESQSLKSASCVFSTPSPSAVSDARGDAQRLGNGQKAPSPDLILFFFIIFV